MCYISFRTLTLYNTIYSDCWNLGQKVNKMLRGIITRSHPLMYCNLEGIASDPKAVRNNIIVVSFKTFSFV